MVLEELSQRTLDEHYVMVTTKWSAPRPAGDTVYLSSTFLLRRASSGMKIVLYLNHQDLSGLLGPSNSAGTTK
jgi:acyl dehydratase